MKTKIILSLLLIVLLVLAVWLIFGNMKLDRETRDLRVKYEAYRRLAMADHDVQIAEIAKANASIVEKNTEIQKLQSDINTQAVHVSNLSSRLDTLQHEAATISDKDKLILNLKGQVSTLTEMYSLAEGIIKQKDAQIVLWSGKYDEQVKISDSWKKMYESEQQLRLLSEGLVQKIDEARAGDKKKIKVLTWVAVAAGAVVGAQAILK